jgi:branched-chain amino acid transport system permease protein
LNPQQIHTLLQTLADGIAVGSVYALIALGYTLVFGILQFINFAHGDVFALGAWLTLEIATALQAQMGEWHHFLWLSAIIYMLAVPLLAIGLCAFTGYCIERFAYKPLRSAPKLNVLITAIGVSLLMENVGQLHWAFGANPKPVPVLIANRVINQAYGVDIHLVDVVVLSIAIALMIALQFVVFRTKFGSAMRAVSFNSKAAALMGIDVDRVISVTFIIGSALAGAAGYLYAMKYQQQTLQQPAASVWILLGMKAFVAAVVGGIGNLRGAMLGGLMIGLIENFGSQYISSEYRDVYVFLLLILVLLIRPSGILGKATVEKV